MESNILLINAGPTGTETMKNLILPGCGHFVVLDGQNVTEADIAKAMNREPRKPPPELYPGVDYTVKDGGDDCSFQLQQL